MEYIVSAKPVFPIYLERQPIKAHDEDKVREVVLEALVEKLREADLKIVIETLEDTE